MKIKRYNDSRAFLDENKAFLEEQEVKNNLMLGIAASGKHKEYFCAAIHCDGSPVLAAVMTPPHNLILTHGREEALKA